MERKKERPPDDLHAEDERRQPKLVYALAAPLPQILSFKVFLRKEKERMKQETKNGERNAAQHASHTGRKKEETESLVLSSLFGSTPKKEAEKERERTTRKTL